MRPLPTSSTDIPRRLTLPIAGTIIDNPCVVMRPNVGARDVEAEDQTGLSFVYYKDRLQVRHRRSHTQKGPTIVGVP